MGNNTKGQPAESTEYALLPKRVKTIVRWVFVLGLLLLWPPYLFDWLPYRSRIQAIGFFVIFGSALIMTVDQLWGLLVFMRDLQYSGRTRHRAGDPRRDTNRNGYYAVLRRRLIIAGMMTAFTILMLILGVQGLV